MKNWIIQLLGGVTMEDHLRYIEQTQAIISDLADEARD